MTGAMLFRTRRIRTVKKGTMKMNAQLAPHQHVPGADVVTEAEALAEMLADLEDGCDPGTAVLREELESRLRLVRGSR